MLKRMGAQTDPEGCNLEALLLSSFLVTGVKGVVAFTNDQHDHADYEPVRYESR